LKLDFIRALVGKGAFEPENTVRGQRKEPRTRAGAGLGVMSGFGCSGSQLFLCAVCPGGTVPAGGFLAGAAGIVPGEAGLSALLVASGIVVEVDFGPVSGGAGPGAACPHPFGLAGAGPGGLGVG
jgi:hypothetical protein